MHKKLNRQPELRVSGIVFAAGIGIAATVASLNAVFEKIFGKSK